MIILAIVAIILRLYGINWDQGFHMHPDERMLMIVADRLNFFKNLNPDFFNYGSLPLYILKGLAQIFDVLLSAHRATYDGMLYLGRVLSAAADMGTFFLVYKITQALFPQKKSAPLYASFAYAIAFFPIQNAHFFVVDVYLTFFLTAVVYLVIRYLQKPQYKFITLLAFFYAAALATKFTAILFFPYLVLICILAAYLSKKNLLHIFLFPILTLVFHFVFMPYAYLSWSKFLLDISQQTQMSRDPYVFPYTLQYVGTLPYLYFLKNIILWGLGPLLTLLAGLGLTEFIKPAKGHKRLLVVVTCFYVIYFLAVGISAVKFMRYMLPLYPLFALLAGLGLHRLKDQFGRYAFFVSIVLTVAWTGLFFNIYFQKNTRIQATEWILHHIPQGSTLAIEHWDDRLPAVGDQNYQYVEMTLYDLPDDLNKWTTLDVKLNQADYIVIASNRLYVPLQKLADCRKFKICYPLTAKYYQALFSSKLGFKKVYEAHVYPSISIMGHTLGIDDQVADESFTVYDHPKILIFKKI